MRLLSRQRLLTAEDSAVGRPAVLLLILTEALFFKGAKALTAYSLALQ
jgi:hypothetical protein